MTRETAQTVSELCDRVAWTIEATAKALEQIKGNGEEYVCPGLVAQITRVRLQCLDFSMFITGDGQPSN